MEPTSLAFRMKSLHLRREKGFKEIERVTTVCKELTLRLKGQRVSNSSLLLLCGQIHIFARSPGILARVVFWGLGL